MIVPFRPYPARNRKFKKNCKKLKKLKNTDMVSSQAKIHRGRQRKRGNKKCRSVPKRRVIENSKKIATKFKKLKSNITASFQAKIGWKRPRKRENKNYHSVPFLPNA